MVPKADRPPAPICRDALLVLCRPPLLHRERRAGNLARVEPVIYRASLRLGFDWKFGFLVFITVASLALPDAGWGARILGGVMACGLGVYAFLVIRIRVEFTEVEVRVRRFRHWWTFRAGDEVGVETLRFGWGAPTQNIILRVSGKRRCRLPIQVFSHADQRKIADQLESVLGREAQLKTRRRHR